MKTPGQIIAKTVNQVQYSEKLHGLEWREFRDRHKDRSCAFCKTDDRTKLQLHHWFYESGKEPWEYDREDMVTLCNSCHYELHMCMNHFRRFVIPKARPDCLAFMRVINAAFSVGLKHSTPIDLAYAVAEMASSPRSVKMFSEAWKPAE